MWFVYLYPLGDSEDMAGEVAEDGSGNARPTGILLREQSGAS